MKAPDPSEPKPYLRVDYFSGGGSLDLAASDVQAMTEQLRRGLTARAPAVVLDGVVEIDEVYVVAGHKGNPAAVAKRGARVAPDG